MEPSRKRTSKQRYVKLKEDARNVRRRARYAALHCTCGKCAIAMGLDVDRSADPPERPPDRSEDLPEPPGDHDDVGTRTGPADMGTQIYTCTYTGPEDVGAGPADTGATRMPSVCRPVWSSVWG